MFETTSVNVTQKFICKHRAKNKKVFNPGSMEFGDQEILGDTRAFCYCQWWQICRESSGNFKQFHKIVK
jgi:hypothetical protein